MSWIDNFKDKQNRFEENYEERMAFNNKLASWVVGVSVFVSLIYFYNDLQNYGINHPITYSQIFLIGTLFANFLSYTFFKTFAFKNFIFLLSLFIYFSFRSTLFQQGVSPTTIFIIILPVASAYSMSLQAHRYFFIGSQLVMSFNLLFFSLVSLSPLKFNWAEGDLRLFGNYIIISLILFVFIYLLIKKEEYSYQLLEKRLEKNSQLCRLSSLGEMSGAIAHEINNPLQIIVGITNLMKKKISVSESVSSTDISYNLSKVLSSVNRMESVVKTMMKLTKKNNTEKEVTSLASVYKLVNPIITSKIISKNITFDFKHDFFDIPIFCNPEAMAQVFINLISNASDAVENISTPWIKVVTRVDEKSIALLFVDAGAGIELAVLDRMFEPFYTTKGVNEGTGMGLSISKRIMEDQDGRLQYHLYEGHTCFEISMPRHNV